MSDELEAQPPTTTFAARFWYFTAWRIVGVLLLALAARNFWSRDLMAGFVALMFGVTYLVLIPMNLTNMFRFGYSTGAGDAVAYAASGDARHLRYGMHPAEPASEIRLRERQWRHAK
jgi:hypothetical protein